MAAEFSLLGPVTTLAGSDLPTFLTRNVNGTLRFRDGETSLIGGLLQGRENASFSGILGIQSIPILNRLGGTRKEKEDTEILISITPHLVRAPKVTEADLASLNIGTRELVRVRGARPPLFGPEETPSPAPGETPAPGVSPPAGARPGPRPTPPPPPGSGTQIPPGPQLPLPSPTPSPSPEEGPPPSAQSQAGPLVSAVFSPPESNVKVNTNGTTSVVLMGAKDVVRVDLALTYDPALMEAVDLASGSLLTVDGATVAVEKNMEPGRVRATLTRPSGVAGSGAVATFTFRGVGVGRSALALESLTLRTATGIQEVLVPAPAQVVVSP
jgi:general secretion pathway protein D